MYHTVRESVSDTPLYSTSGEHLPQGDTLTPNRTTGIELGPGPSIHPERHMAQAVRVNQILGSHHSTMGNNSVPNFVTYNNEIEGPVSSLTANNNSASSKTLLEETRLESRHDHVSFGVDLDFPILTGEPMVEVDFEVIDDILAIIGEIPPTTALMFDEVSMADIAALEPTAFSINNSVNTPSATGQSTINYLNTCQPEVGATTASSFVPSSQDPQRTNGIAKAINTSSKHSNRVKHLAPKQLPIYRTHPPGSTPTRGTHRYISIPDILLIHTGHEGIVVKSARPLIMK